MQKKKRKVHQGNTNLAGRPVSCNELFKVVHVLKLTDIYNLHLGKFIFSQIHINSTTPVLISNVLNHNVYQYETQNQYRLHIDMIECARKRPGARSFSYKRTTILEFTTPSSFEHLNKSSFLNQLKHELLASY